MLASQKLQEKLNRENQYNVSRNGDLVEAPINLTIHVFPFSQTGTLKLNNNEVKVGVLAELLAEADRIESLTKEELVAEFKLIF